MRLEYGDKRDYKKIDIYVDGVYKCSTTWSRTCTDAIARYYDRHPELTAQNKVVAHFAKRR